MSSPPHQTLVRTEPQLVDQVQAPVDRGEVLRYMGYPAGVTPQRRLAELLDRWIDEAAKRAQPRAAYLVLPVVQKDRRLLRVQHNGDQTEFNGAIGEFLGASRCVAAFVATAGPGVEQLASQLLRQGDDVAAMIVNAVGGERAEAAESEVIERLKAQAAPIGFAPTLPYSPGYCGMALTEQRKLFALFGGTAAGVRLTPDCLMQPLKSVSGLIGLGPAEEVEAFGTPCDRCELYNCSMRR